MNTVVLSVFVTLCSAMLVAGRAFNPSAWNLSFKDDDFDKRSHPIAAPVWFLKTDKVKKGVMPASLWFHDTDDGDFRKRAQAYWNDAKVENIPDESSWHRNRRDVASMMRLWRQHLSDDQ